MVVVFPVWERPQFVDVLRQPACLLRQVHPRRLHPIRVPNIVISPFTKAHYVGHTVMDTTGILKLIETRFNLPSLTARYGNSPDMTEFFDFQNVPWRTPPSSPVQPTRLVQRVITPFAVSRRLPANLT